MAAVHRRLKRIEVYCPEYETTATIRINDAHSSGTDHLEVDYRSPDHSHFRIAIPDEWTDQDLLELIFYQPAILGHRIGRLGKFRLTASCRSSCSGSGKARRNQPGEPVANAASATFSTVNLALESRSHTTAGVFEPGRKRRPPPKRHSLVESHVRNKHLINFVVERADSI